MSKVPFFSVVMPTRNRAELLPFAIRSVLNQSFGDFEIIVSDNFSTDQTREVVESIGDQRIKYFRTASSLPMGDSWEFALSQATGRYITFLSDDDAYAKLFLEKLSTVINSESADVVTCRLAPFYTQSSHEYGLRIPRNSLVLTPFDRKLSVLKRSDAMKVLYSQARLMETEAQHRAVRIPQLVNTAYSFSVVQRVKSRVPKIFPIVGSDIYSAALFLNAANKFCFINEPLYLHAIWDGSATVNEQSFFEKYPDERRLEYVPLKLLFSSSNYVTNTVLRAKADWGPDFHQLEADWVNYFIRSHDEIRYKEASKIDMSIEIREFELSLAAQSKELRRKVSNSISGYSTTKTRMKLAIRNSALGKLLLRIKNRNVRIHSGFNDIAHCGEMIDSSFLDRNSERPVRNT